VNKRIPAVILLALPTLFNRQSSKGNSVLKKTLGQFHEFIKFFLTKNILGSLFSGIRKKDMRRKEPEKAENLIKCAFKLFSERGIAQVNVDAIAAEAGVTKGSVYHHFKSKHELILGACQNYYQNWQHNTYQKIFKAKTSKEKLEIAIRYSVKNCLLDEKNRVFTLDILTMSIQNEEVRRSWGQFLKTCHQFFTGLVNQAIKDGEIDECDNVDERVNFMLCAMEGVKQQAIFDRSSCSRENEEKIIQSLLKSLTS